MGGGGGSTVNVIDQRGSKAPPPEVEKQNTGNREQITILIRDEVGRQLKAGEHNKAMKSGYGVRQPPMR